MSAPQFVERDDRPQDADQDCARRLGVRGYAVEQDSGLKSQDEAGPVMFKGSNQNYKNYL
jgi:hypothetical protein